MPPVIAIIGKGNSGKTTLLIKMITELTKRGYRIATIKHSFHKLKFDKPETDSWRHIQAGSQATLVSSDDTLIMIKPSKEKYELDNIIELYGEDYDLILIEGYKKSKYPKIEVHRKVVGPPLTGVDNIVAIATDEKLDLAIDQFSLDDSNGIVDYIEHSIIKPYKQNISLYINNRNIDLHDLNESQIKKVILILISTLKSIKYQDIYKIKLFFRK